MWAEERGTGWGAGGSQAKASPPVAVAVAGGVGRSHLLKDAWQVGTRHLLFEGLSRCPKPLASLRILGNGQKKRKNKKIFFCPFPSCSQNPAA